MTSGPDTFFREMGDEAGRVGNDHRKGQGGKIWSRDRPESARLQPAGEILPIASPRISLLSEIDDGEGGEGPFAAAARFGVEGGFARLIGREPSLGIPPFDVRPTSLIGRP